MDAEQRIGNVCTLISQALENLTMAGAEVAGRNPEADAMLREIAERLSELECDVCKCGFRLREAA